MTSATQPPGWRTVPVTDLVTISHGFAFKGEFFSPHGRDALATPGNFIESGGFRHTGEKQRYYVAPFPETYRLDAGDLIVAMTQQAEGLLGSGAFVPHAGHWLHNQRVGRIRPKSRDVSLKYMFHIFNSFEFRKAVAGTAAGTKVRHTSPTKLGAIEILLPPRAERERIAEALDDVDEMILRLERLVAKKQAIKQGMMQQLVSGETRLHGFSAGWISVSWGEVTERCVSGATPLRSRDDFYGGKIPWVTSTELKYGRITQVPQRITAAGLAAASLKVWPEGTFLMAITGLEAAGTRGSCGLLGMPAATNQSCMAIVPNQRLSTDFLYYFYLLHGEDLALRYCQGTKQQSYTAGIVKTLPMFLPMDVSEQRAIAKVLADADDEIDRLRATPR